MAKVHNGEEILPKVSTPEYDAGTLHTTDRFATAKRRTSCSHVVVKTASEWYEQCFNEA